MKDDLLDENPATVPGIRYPALRQGFGEFIDLIRLCHQRNIYCTIPPRNRNGLPPGTFE